MDLIKQFGINPVLLAAQAVNFLVLLFILKRLLYKPLLKVLNERREKIEKSLKDASEIEQKLLQIEEDREKILKKAADEARRLIGEAEAETVEIIKEAHLKAASDIENMLADARVQINSEREKMQSEIKSELGVIVVNSLQKVTGKILNKKDKDSINSTSIKNLS